jgi:hypothetical protein
MGGTKKSRFHESPATLRAILNTVTHAYVCVGPLAYRHSVVGNMNTNDTSSTSATVVHLNVHSLDAISSCTDIVVRVISERWIFMVVNMIRRNGSMH